MARQNKTKLLSVQGFLLRHIHGRDAIQLVTGGRARDLTPRPKIGPLEYFPAVIQMKEMQRQEAANSPATITMGDMLAATGVCGESRTAYMTESRKIERDLAGFRAEDFIELAETKIQVWPEIGDTLAVRVGPAPTVRVQTSVSRPRG